VKFLLDNWILVLMAVASGGLLLWTTFGRGIASGAVSTAEAVRLINREKAVLIDISEPADYAAAHVAGAKNVPLATIETAKNLPSNKALPLVVVCANGSRAPRAVAILKNWAMRMRRPWPAAWQPGAKPSCPSIRPPEQHAAARLDLLNG
jgi:rhodanese-related sulfurtransferase